MTKLFLASLIALSATSAFAVCNPEQEYCPVRVVRQNDGKEFVPTVSGVCNPETTYCADQIKPAGVPAWLEKWNSMAPANWKMVSPFDDSKGQ